MRLFELTSNCTLFDRRRSGTVGWRAGATDCLDRVRCERASNGHLPSLTSAADSRRVSKTQSGSLFRTTTVGDCSQRRVSRTPTKISSTPTNRRTTADATCALVLSAPAAGSAIRGPWVSADVAYCAAVVVSAPRK